MIKWLSRQSWAPINSYGPCIGITLWKWGRTKVELWWAPADYEPPEHTHEDVDGEFTILYSKNRYIYRKSCPRGGPCGEKMVGIGDSYIATTPDVWGKWLSVRAGTPHAFKRGDSCMIWIVKEKWLPGRKVGSMSTDFHLT